MEMKVLTFLNDILTSGKLQINGNDRFQEINLEHFKLIQPFQHHSSSPSVEYYKKEIINFCKSYFLNFSIICSMTALPSSGSSGFGKI